MAEKDYAEINAVWESPKPPIGRVEANAAARELYRVFGRKEDASAVQRFPLRWRGPKDVRHCWLSPKPTTGHHKGWGRLVHDISHIVFRYRHPTFRPHDYGHAHLELDIAQYVMKAGWLEGKLRPPVKPKLTTQEKRQQRLQQLDRSLARWTTKAKRAQTALRKLRTKRRELERLIAQQCAVCGEPKVDRHNHRPWI